MIFTTSSLPTCPLREEKSFSQRAFSIYTDIRKLQDKAKTSYMSQTAYIVWKGGADEILDQLHFIRVEA